MELDVSRTLGWTGGLFVAASRYLSIDRRIAGGRLSGAGAQETRWTGLALLPQVGGALGMAQVAGESVPQWAEVIMALTIASTVIFEIIGPLIALAARRRTTDGPGDEPN